jgi:hypothetical protein
MKTHITAVLSVFKGMTTFSNYPAIVEHITRIWLEEYIR